MIKTRAVYRLQANATPTLPGSTSAHDQSAVRASENPTELDDGNNAPGAEFTIPVEASPDNPVIAPEKDFKPTNPNPDSSTIVDSTSVKSRAVARLKASLGA